MDGLINIAALSKLSFKRLKSSLKIGLLRIFITQQSNSNILTL